MADRVRYRYRLVPDRCFEYVSPGIEKLIGYTPEEHYADPDLGRKIVHKYFADAIERCFGEDPRSASLHVCWIHKDGSEVWVEQFNSVIRDENGLPIAVEGFAEPREPPPGWTGK